jgi:hypothetical protein
VSGIPRYMFYWNYSEEGDSEVRSSVMAEVDADKGELKSLYYGNITFWNQRPPIDVPILLPASIQTNPPLQRVTSPRKEKSDQREFPKVLIK